MSNDALTPLQTYTKFLIDLCVYVIEGKKVENLPPEIDMEAFFEFCSLHKLENIVCQALEENGLTDFDYETLIKFKEKYKHSIVIDASQQYYIDVITEEFANAGIDYLLLKGSFLKKIYPSTNLRQSSDTDIYIGPKSAEKAKEIMEKIGFETLAYGANLSSDNYVIDKNIYIELHRVLIKNNYKWKKECNSITDRLISKGNHELVMSDEDFYIFMIAHIAKHVKCGGIGVRAILDVWIYHRYYKNLDWDYIKAGIRNCDLELFYKKLTDLCNYWFKGSAPEDKDIIKLADYIAFSGWNGTAQQLQSAHMMVFGGETHSKFLATLKRYFRVIFASKDAMSKRYTVLNKYSVLLPLCWIHRAFSVLFCRREKIADVTKSFEVLNDEESKKINQFRKELGV